MTTQSTTGTAGQVGSTSVLLSSTYAFTICFAVWTIFSIISSFETL